ncbi:MAG: dioxygenase [Hyphomicrobiales bacterium]|nr:dioxygenase [Hyphomicrobiales bacterium]
MQKLPTFFVSHGSPNIVLHDSPARRFLEGLAASIPRPNAILVMSAHFEHDTPVVVADREPKMIYDFGGFEPELYTMTYSAPGALDLAATAADMATKAGVKTFAATGRGYDHGTWTALKLIYPNADIPVAQIAVQPHEGGRHHAQLGRALAPLREQGVLVLGSGSLTHNLRAFFAARNAPGPAPAWAQDFGNWVEQKASAGDLDAIADFEHAPDFQKNHPSDEHFLPFPFAFGAAGPGATGQRIHASSQSVLLLDAYRFG